MMNYFYLLPTVIIGMNLWGTTAVHQEENKNNGPQIGFDVTERFIDENTGTTAIRAFASERCYIILNDPHMKKQVNQVLQISHTIRPDILAFLAGKDILHFCEDFTPVLLTKTPDLQRYRRAVAAEGEEGNLDAAEGEEGNLDAAEGKEGNLEASEGEEGNLDAAEGEDGNLDAAEIEDDINPGATTNITNLKESIDDITHTLNNLDAAEGEDGNLDAAEIEDDINPGATTNITNLKESIDDITHTLNDISGTLNKLIATLSKPSVNKDLTSIINDAPGPTNKTSEPSDISNSPINPQVFTSINDTDEVTGTLTETVNNGTLTDTVTSSTIDDRPDTATDITDASDAPNDAVILTDSPVGTETATIEIDPVDSVTNSSTNASVSDDNYESLFSSTNPNTENVTGNELTDTTNPFNDNPESVFNSTNLNIENVTADGIADITNPVDANNSEVNNTMETFTTASGTNNEIATDEPRDLTTEVTEPSSSATENDKTSEIMDSDPGNGPEQEASGPITTKGLQSMESVTDDLTTESSASVTDGSAVTASPESNATETSIVRPEKAVVAAVNANGQEPVDAAVNGNGQEPVVAEVNSNSFLPVDKTALEKTMIRLQKNECQNQVIVDCATQNSAVFECNTGPAEVYHATTTCKSATQFTLNLTDRCKEFEKTSKFRFIKCLQAFITGTNT